MLTNLDHRSRGRLNVVTEFGEPDPVTCYPSLLNQALRSLSSS